MTVPERWPGQDRGGKKKKKKEKKKRKKKKKINSRNPIKHPLRGSLNMAVETQQNKRCLQQRAKIKIEGFL